MVSTICTILDTLHVEWQNSISLALDVGYEEIKIITILPFREQASKSQPLHLQSDPVPLSQNSH